MRPAKPFDSLDEANEASKRFFDAIAAVRDGYGIHDVLIVTRCEIVRGDGTQSGMSYYQLGDGLGHESMAAWAFGKLQVERKELLAQFLAGKE